MTIETLLTFGVLVALTVVLIGVKWGHSPFKSNSPYQLNELELKQHVYKSQELWFPENTPFLLYRHTHLSLPKADLDSTKIKRSI